MAHLPGQLAAAARSSVGGALSIARQGPGPAQPLVAGVIAAFMSGLHAGCVVAAAVCLVGAAGALALPGRRPRPAPPAEDGPVAAAEVGPVAAPAVIVR